jgi:translation initiation factor IF-3
MAPPPRFQQPAKPRSDEPRINRQIRAQEIRLIGADGEMVGVTTPLEGLKMAQAAGLDLVEISPNAAPPVCKIMDFGKFKYEQQKKANEARKKQKVIVMKEVKVRPNIDKHDLEVKMKQVDGFLKEGDKVKFTMQFRGREMAHQDIGRKVMAGIREQLGDTVKYEQEPRMEGRNLIMIVAPK